VHELILERVRPILIVAYGNSDVSPYAFLRSVFRPTHEDVFPSGHGAWLCRAFSTGNMCVAGLPHLGRYAIDRHPDVGRWLKTMMRANLALEPSALARS
jgi:hypothetical protein